MATVRAVDRFILRHPEDGRLVTVGAGQPFQSDDPLVRAFEWAFAGDEPVETASSAPGEKRARRSSK